MRYEIESCRSHGVAARWTSVIVVACCLAASSVSVCAVSDHVYEFVDGDWRLPVPGTRVDFYYDLTPEQAEPSSANGDPHPLLIFSDRDFNDHLFTDESRYRHIRGTALRLWKKYRDSEGISGLLILMDRNDDTGSNWVRRLAADLANELGDVRIFSNCDALPYRPKDKELDLFSYFRADDRLSKTTELVRDSKRGQVIVKGASGGVLATAAKGLVYHFAGAGTLAVDIETLG